MMRNKATLGAFGALFAYYTFCVVFLPFFDEDFLLKFGLSRLFPRRVEAALFAPVALFTSIFGFLFFKAYRMR